LLHVWRKQSEMLEVNLYAYLHSVLLACEQDFSKSYEWVFIKFCTVRLGAGNSVLDFGMVLKIVWVLHAFYDFDPISWVKTTNQVISVSFIGVYQLASENDNCGHYLLLRYSRILLLFLDYIACTQPQMSYVAWSLCLCVEHMVSCAKTTESIEMQVRGLIHVSPRNHVSDGGPDLPREWAILGNVRPTEKH